MADIWQISLGSSSTKSDLEDYGIEGGTLTMGSLQTDEFNFVQKIKDASQAHLLIPYETEVTLWRNGARYFKGWLTDRRRSNVASGEPQVVSTVSGLWWMLKKVPMSGIAHGHDPANTEERIAFGLLEGELKDHIIAIIDRAKNLGVDVNVGGISTCFPVPQITLKEYSVADALIALMRMLPDAMFWINYGLETPTINIKRRQYAGINTLTVGSRPLVDFEMNPRIELEVSQVTASYVERDVTGATVLKQFVAGEPDNALAFGKRQIYTVSGAELDTYLPNDLFDTYEMQTKPLSGLRDLVNDLVPGFSEALAAGMPAAAVSLAATNWPHYKFVPGGELEHVVLNGPQYNIHGGGAVSDYHVVVGDRPPEWVREEHDVREFEVKGSWWYLHYLRELAQPASENAAPPAWLSELKGGVLTYGWETSSGGSLHNFYSGEYTLKGYIIATDYSTATTIYRKADYGYVKPPAGFAEGLLSTQNFVPYEGTVVVAHREAGEVDYRGRCINISGDLPEYSTMKALVQSVELELETGITRINCGMPEALSYLGIVNKFRNPESDNIVWLNGTNLSGGGATSGSGNNGSDSLGGATNSGGATTGTATAPTGGTTTGTSGSSGGSTSQDNGSGDSPYTEATDKADYSVSYQPYNHTIRVSGDDQTFILKLMGVEDLENTLARVVVSLEWDNGSINLFNRNIIGGDDGGTFVVALPTAIAGYYWFETQRDQSHDFSFEITMVTALLDNNGATLWSDSRVLIRQAGTINNNGTLQDGATSFPPLGFAQLDVNYQSGT